MCSTSAGGDLSSDAQIRVMGQMKREICSKILKKWSKKLRSKFAATTPGCSMVKVAHLNDAFLEVLLPLANPVEGQSLQQKERERRKRKGEKKIPKIEKPKDVGHFLHQNFDICACPSQNVTKWDASGKKAKLS